MNAGNARRAALADLLPVMAWALLALLCLRPLFGEGHVPIDANLLRLFFPTWAVGKSLWREGAVLWDPFRNMGQPFWANPQSQAAYFFTYLTYGMDFTTAYLAHTLFHLGCLFGFTVLLFRDGEHGRESALLAAALLAFGGFTLSKATLWPYLATMAWTPAVLYFLQRRRPLWLGAVLALQWTAGFPPYALVTALSALCWALAERGRRTGLIALGKGLLWAAGLAAAQWLPFLELFRQASRPALLGETLALENAVPLGFLAQSLLLPALVPRSAATGWPGDASVWYFFWGPLATGLFLYGLARGGARERVLGTLSLLCFFLATGSAPALWSWIPPLRIFRFPAHWLWPASLFALPALVRGYAAVRPRWLRGALWVGVVADVVLFAQHPRVYLADPRLLTETPATLSLATAANGHRVFHPTPILDRLSSWEIRDPEDWLSLIRMGPPSLPVAGGVRELSSYEVLTSFRHEHFLALVMREGPASPLLDKADVATVVTLREKPADSTRRIPEFARIERAGARGRVFGEDGAQVLGYGQAPGLFTVTARGPGAVVVSESWFPGWSLEVDGTPQQPGLTDRVFLSAAIPAGEHRLVFRYRPRSVVWGSALSVSTLLAGLAVLLLRKRQLFARLA